MLGEEIVRLKEVDSTNRFMMDWMGRERPQEGIVVVTDYQSAGRGMDRNRWESEAGLNLTFSFVLYPSFLAVDAQFYLNKAIALGLTDLVAEKVAGRGHVMVKWPNDVYIDNHKVAGILIQNGVKGSLFDFAIVGIGLNVNQESFLSDAANPVSLKMVTGRGFDLTELLDELMRKISLRYDMLREGHKTVLDQHYLDALFRLGEKAGYFYKDRQIDGIIRGVNRYGQLLVEIPGEKIIECDLKEIKFLI